MATTLSKLLAPLALVTACLHGATALAAPAEAQAAAPVVDQAAAATRPSAVSAGDAADSAPATDAPSVAATKSEVPAPASASGGEDAAASGEDAAASADVVPASQVLQTLQTPPDDRVAQQLSFAERNVKGIETEYGGFDPRLVGALLGLGRAQRDANRPGDAIETFDRAQHVSRVNHGLNNPEQIEVLHEVADTLVGIGNVAEATKAEEQALALARRAHPADSLELVQSLERMGDWYVDVGQIIGSRFAYEESLAIMQAQLPESDLRIADGLKKLATSYRMERFPEYVTRTDPEFSMSFGSSPSGIVQPRRELTPVNRFRPGEAALIHVVEIQQKQEPVDRAALVNALVELGDWYTLFEKWERADAIYDVALKQLNEPEFAALRHELFGEPHLIYLRPPETPRRPSVGPNTQVPEYTGHVTFTYDITARGQVTNINLVDAVPSGIIDISASKSMRAARFRPLYGEGDEALPAPNQSFRYEYIYYERQPDPAESTSADIAR